MDEKLLKEFQEHQYKKWLEGAFPTAACIGLDVHPDGSFDVAQMLSILSSKGSKYPGDFYKEYFERGSVDFSRAMQALEATVFEDIFDKESQYTSAFYWHEDREGAASYGEWKSK